MWAWSAPGSRVADARALAPRRAGWTVLLVVLATAAAAQPHPAAAQTELAVPFYRDEHALQGLYAHHLPARWQAFEQAAASLASQARKHCDGQAPKAQVHQAWVDARLAWLAASNPALGEVLTRRSQREIDFWPMRAALLQRALAADPQNLAQMARVGGPAKGFPTLEHLLAQPAPAPCPYLALVAEGIEAEARALRQAFDARAATDWSADEPAAKAAFGEWVNQWLGGLESLRWQQIEQPVQKARTSGPGEAPAFARRRWADNRADWQAQWQALYTQARWPPAARREPPRPGQALVPIEALLLGRGHIATAQRWGAALDAADAAVSALTLRTDEPSPAELLALSSRLKAVTSLYQREVAAALDVPLGFSSADGD